MDFHLYMKNLREQKGYTQEDAADEIGVSVNTIQNWENNRSKPTLDLMKSIGRAYGVKASEISSKAVEDIEEEIQESYEDTTYKYMHLLPDDVLREIENQNFKFPEIKFNKLEQDIFMTLALSIQLKSDPMPNILKLDNDIIKIMNILDKFKDLIRGFDGERLYLTRVGNLVTEVIKNNPDELFNIHNLSIFYFMRLCYELDVLSEKTFNVVEILRLVTKQSAELNYYKNNRMLKYTISNSDYTEDMLTIEYKSLEKFIEDTIPIGYYEIIKEEVQDPEYLKLKEEYEIKKAFYDENKLKITDIRRPVPPEELFIEKVIPSKKAIEFITLFENEAKKFKM